MKILYLYPRLMNLYGEYGNIIVLKKHLIDQGIDVLVDEIDDVTGVTFEDYDFIYCGSGLESNQKIALSNFIANKDSFISAVNKGTYILFTGNAMEMLGTSIDDKEALNIIDMKTVSTLKRYSGDVVVNNDLFSEVVGFINRCTVIETNCNPLFEFIFKDKGLCLKDNKEGYRFNNTFGTHIIGPILVKNPKMMKYFVTQLATKENNSFKYKEINYKYEEDSYSTTLNALKERAIK